MGGRGRNDAAAAAANEASKMGLAENTLKLYFKECAGRMRRLLAVSGSGSGRGLALAPFCSHKLRRSPANMEFGAKLAPSAVGPVAMGPAGAPANGPTAEEILHYHNVVILLSHQQQAAGRDARRPRGANVRRNLVN